MPRLTPKLRLQLHPLPQLLLLRCQQAVLVLLLSPKKPIRGDSLDIDSVHRCCVMKTIEVSKIKGRSKDSLCKLGPYPGVREGKGVLNVKSMLITLICQARTRTTDGCKRSHRAWSGEFPTCGRAAFAGL